MILTLMTLTKVQESGVGGGLDKTSALCTVVNEKEAEEVAGTLMINIMARTFTMDGRRRRYFYSGSVS